MRPVFTSNARAFLLSVVTATLLTTSAYADCTYELFNIASVKGTSVGDFIDQISDECGMSVIVTDSEAEKILLKQMNKTYLKNLTINEVLDLIVKENGLQYTLQNNVLKVSYLSTKTYNIDYIISQRKGEGQANVTLSGGGASGGTASGGAVSGGAASSSSASGGGASGGAAGSQSGINITSSDEVMFWDILDKEIADILNRPEDNYKAALPMINKHAGLITVSATGQQIKRLDAYLDQLQKKMQTQVLIDVKMYSVTFSDGSTTGIDWSQLYALEKVNLKFDWSKDFNNPDVKTFTLGAGGSLDQVIKFLKTQGDVSSISNPKVLTLNNQTALITAGTELFYKITNSTTSTGTATTQTNNEIINSVFSGVLLDITPEISNDGTITLRINPSLSEAVGTISSNNASRTMPPDLSRRQMSSVISVKDGSRVILGGLISTKMTTDGNKLPILGSIPGLGWLFKTETTSKKTEEIVMIIEPHIIKKEGNKVGLSDLGYQRINSPLEKELLELKEVSR